MDKLVDGILYTKAKFLRTTCKNCRKQLSKEFINNHSNFCSRICRVSFVRKSQVKGGRKKAEKVYEKHLMSFGLLSSACDSNSTGNF